MREDEYGRTEDGRRRLLLEVVEAVRAALPDRLPLLVCLSATDWRADAPGGVEGDLERTVALAAELQGLGVDLVDVSSGATSPTPRFPSGRATRPVSPPPCGRASGSP